MRNPQNPKSTASLDIVERIVGRQFRSLWREVAPSLVELGSLDLDEWDQDVEIHSFSDANKVKVNFLRPYSTDPKAVEHYVAVGASMSGDLLCADLSSAAMPNDCSLVLFDHADGEEMRRWTSIREFVACVLQHRK